MWRLDVFLLEALMFKYGDNVAYENFAKALFNTKHKYSRESRDVLGGRNEVCDSYMRKADCDKKS